MNTEVKCCLDCATSGIFQQITPGHGCPCCGAASAIAFEPREFWQTKEQWVAAAFNAMGSHRAALVASAPVEIEAVKEPCCHVKVIRRFYAIALHAGLDVKQVDRMRGAFSMALGRRVESRKQLTADNWAYLGDLAENGVLIW